MPRMRCFNMCLCRLEFLAKAAYFDRFNLLKCAIYIIIFWCTLLPVLWWPVETFGSRLDASISFFCVAPRSGLHDTLASSSLYYFFVRYFIRLFLLNHVQICCWMNYFFIFLLRSMVCFLCVKLIFRRRQRRSRCLSCHRISRIVFHY